MFSGKERGFLPPCPCPVDCSAPGRGSPGLHASCGPRLGRLCSGPRGHQPVRELRRPPPSLDSPLSCKAGRPACYVPPCTCTERECARPGVRGPAARTLPWERRGPERARIHPALGLQQGLWLKPALCWFISAPLPLPFQSSPPFVPHEVLEGCLAGPKRGFCSALVPRAHPSATPDPRLHPSGPLVGLRGPGCCCAATCWRDGRLMLSGRAGHPCFPSLGHACKCKRLSAPLEQPCHSGDSTLQVGPSPAPCPSHPVEEDAQALPLRPSCTRGSQHCGSPGGRQRGSGPAGSHGQRGDEGPAASVPSPCPSPSALCLTLPPASDPLRGPPRPLLTSLRPICRPCLCAPLPLLPLPLGCLPSPH